MEDDIILAEYPKVRKPTDYPAGPFWLIVLFRDLNLCDRGEWLNCLEQYCFTDVKDWQKCLEELYERDINRTDITALKVDRVIRIRPSILIDLGIDDTHINL